MIGVKCKLILLASPVIHRNSRTIPLKYSQFRGTERKPFLNTTMICFVTFTDSNNIEIKKVTGLKWRKIIWFLIIIHDRRGAPLLAFKKKEHLKLSTLRFKRMMGSSFLQFGFQKSLLNFFTGILDGARYCSVHRWKGKIRMGFQVVCLHMFLENTTVVGDYINTMKTTFVFDFYLN